MLHEPGSAGGASATRGGVIVNAVNGDAQLIVGRHESFRYRVYARRIGSRSVGPQTSAAHANARGGSIKRPGSIPRLVALSAPLPWSISCGWHSLISVGANAVALSVACHRPAQCSRYHDAQPGVRADAYQREWFACSGVGSHAVPRAPLNSALVA